ncbi:helix-turn-helix domain-containing protein [Acinetobacter bereziniae]|uniref:helix-turn-helix domain-containing protein n=1 Tax=Acinetobacter bereziniae TaxID=106648 RepID=UPI00125027A2|nr:AraC family transcriptional regulator [Acinetobacter bereziniae]
MKSFLKIKSVRNSLTLLLDDFCKKNELDSPKNLQNTFNDHIPFGEWLNKIKEISEQYPKEGLGLEIGALVQANHIGVVAYIAQSCDTFADYIEILSKYERLWFNYIPKKINFGEEFFSISWEKPAYVKAGLYIKETSIVEEMQVSIIYHHLQQLMDSAENAFHRLDLAIPEPENIEKYTQLFNCPVYFNTEQTKIVFSNTILQTKLKCYDPTLLEILSDHANILLKKMPKHDSLIELVNLSVIQALEHNNVQIHFVARSLNITPRMLQRDLRSRGSSFKLILANARKNLAKKHLRNERLAITEIAFLLAYKDQTSFNRAFRGWTGFSPSEWRKQYLDKRM